MQPFELKDNRTSCLIVFKWPRSSEQTLNRPSQSDFNKESFYLIKDVNSVDSLDIIVRISDWIDSSGFFKSFKSSMDSHFGILQTT